MSALNLILENRMLREAAVQTPRVELKESNLGPNIRQFEFVNIGHKHIPEFLFDINKIYIVKISESAAQYDEKIKTKSYLSIELEKSNQSFESDITLFEKQLIYIPSKLYEVSFSDIDEHFRLDIFEHLMKTVENLSIDAPGFKLKRIIQFSVQIFYSNTSFEFKRRGLIE